MHRVTRRASGDRGAVTVLMSVLLPLVMIALCALVVDLGMARDVRREAQNAADSSALAAGNVLYLGLHGHSVDFAQAVVEARAYALKNFGVSSTDWVACTDPSPLAFRPDPTTGCISFDSSTLPTRVRVRVPLRPSSTPFAGLWGRHTIPVTAEAEIQLHPGGQAPCGFCVLGTGNHDLQNGKIIEANGNVDINGTLSTNPQAAITVTGTGVGINLQQPSQPTPLGNFTPMPVTSQLPITDPLATMPMPDYSTLSVKSNACTGGPGIYDHLTNGCTLAPGLYVLTGSTSLNGSGTLVANGVTLYFVCGTTAAPRSCAVGETGGQLSIGGSAALTITAPTTGPTQGLAIVADRNDTGTFSIGGTSGSSSSGTIYAASGTLSLNGTPAGYAQDSVVVVKDLTFAGSPTIFNATATAGNNYWLASAGMHLSD